MDRARERGSKGAQLLLSKMRFPPSRALQSAVGVLAVLGLACGGGSSGEAKSGRADAATVAEDAGSDTSTVVLPSDGGERSDASAGLDVEVGLSDASTPLVDGPADSGFHEGPHASPTIPDNGGPILSHPELVTITFAGDPERAFAEKLGAYLVQSPWLVAVGAEYGIGIGTQVPVELTEAAPATVDDTAIQALIATLILQGTAPAPTGGSVIAVSGGSPFDGGTGSTGATDGGPTAVLLPAVYMIYIPTTTTETVDGSELCDVSGGGYHYLASGSFDGQTFAYAVVSQCPMTQQADLETAVSHELIEACTDPAYTAPARAITDPNSVWSLFGGEVGDLCSFVEPQWSEGGYTALQRVYSNKSATAGGDPCLPSAGLYYATDVEPQTFVNLTAGNGASFSVAGWSTGLVMDWELSATAYISQPTSFMPTFSLGASTLNNGETTSISVQVPAGTASQSYALLLVGSAFSQTNYNYSLVGVYVP